MTACPAGVNYAELFEHARAEVETKNILTISQTIPNQTCYHQLAFHGSTETPIPGIIDETVSTIRFAGIDSW
jgi:hypothetical protein